jgi:hypothetical protein
MDKLDFIQHVEFFEKNGANQAIKITACEQTVFIGGHCSLLNQPQGGMCFDYWISVPTGAMENVRRSHRKSQADRIFNERIGHSSR